MGAGARADIDKQSIVNVERQGVNQLLDELAADLKDGRRAADSGTPGVYTEAWQADLAAAVIDPNGFVTVSCRQQ